VPALPRNSSAWLARAATQPSMTAVVPSTTTPQPSWRSACSMTRVSSESSRSCTVVRPSHSAASSSTRLEMLLEPGRRTVPDTDAQRRNVEEFGIEHTG
jgi:hypothetical protein